jgi:hypothetical protein
LKVKPTTPSTYHAIAGLDWGDGSHAVSLRYGNDPVDQFMLPSQPEKVHGWLRDLDKRLAGKPLAVAVEVGRGALIEQLQEHDFVDIYALNPATTSLVRKAFTPSRAKDDLPDSLLHLNIVDRHWNDLRLLQPRAGIDKRLDFLTRQRRKLRDDSSCLCNKLRDCLKAYYPVALELTGELDSKMAAAFLTKWPSLDRLKRARPETIAKFYRASGSRNQEKIEERLEKIRLAESVSNDPALREPMAAYMGALTAQIEVLRQQIEKFDQLIDEAYEQHPDKAIWHSFPGAGPALAPRLAAAWGCDRDKYQTAHEMQLYSAAAPVTERSGKGKEWVHRRWSKPRFLHQSFWEFAEQSTRQCRWAKAYLDDQLAKGKTYPTAVRALAFKWQRIMFACWKKGECYNDALYEASLAKRGSKFAAPTEKDPTDRPPSEAAVGGTQKA